MTRHSRPSRFPRVATIVGATIVGGLITVSAHNNFTFPAPAKPAPTIDGTIEAAWGTAMPAGVNPDSCAQFLGNTGLPVQFFGLKDPNNFYLAFRIDDTTPSGFDRLVLFLDSNHSASATLQAGDVAFDLPFAAASGTASVTAATGGRKFRGDTGSWTLDTFPATTADFDAKYTRTASRLEIEVKINKSQVNVPAATPVGFAFVYLNQTEFTTDTPGCATVTGPGQLIAFSDVQPGSVVLPAVNATLPDAVSNPSQWGDLGKDLPIVTFNPPDCCFSTDIHFNPIFANKPVDVSAIVHPANLPGNNNDAKNIRVNFNVHNFGTNGPPITPLGDKVLASLDHTNAAGDNTPAATWAGAPLGFHGCFTADILGSLVSSDDYALGSLTHVQHNIDVTAVAMGMMKRMTFVTFNPDTATAQPIRLIPMQRGPRMDGLTLEVVQPEGPVGPLREVNAALVVTAAANLPRTDLPRQRVHVPPTAGRNTAVDLQVKPGDRLHLSAIGAVDIDAAGPVPSAGPDGTDVSNTLRGQFLLSGDSAARYGGALIGSFDGFETSFPIGSAFTLIVPDRAQTLRLAINDLVERNTDNTGAGFDVDGWTLPPDQRPAPAPTGGGDAAAAVAPAAAAPAEPPFPEVTIVATAGRQIRMAGIDHVYNVPSNLGAATYQILITDQGATSPSPVKNYWWLILLIVLVIAVLLVLRRRKTA